KLKKFKETVSTNRLIRYWDKIEELPALVALSLSKTIKTYPAVGWIRSNVSNDPTVYKQLSELQSENQELRKLQCELQEQKQLESLAGLDDEYEISGIRRRWDGSIRSDVNTPWNIKLTWRQLFTSFSPYLINKPADS